MVKLFPEIVNIFPVTTIQFLLNPKLGKSNQFALDASASKEYKFQTPVGSLVCETPINTAEFAAPPFAAAENIHRLLKGSYKIFGSKVPGLPTEAQNAFRETVLMVVPVKF